MTSKRVGMVIAAVFVLWSLAGFGWFVPTPSDWTDDVLVVGNAFAGDPDYFENGNDPGDGGNSGDDPPSGEEPEPPPEDEDQSSRDDDSQIIESIVSLILWGLGATTF